MAQGLSLDWAALPYTPEALEYLRGAQAAGRQLVLVSACDRSLAEPIAQHLGLFTEVIASDGQTNLKGEAKAGVLIERFGWGGFDYVGNERADVPVWEAARERLVVNAPPRLLRPLGAADQKPARPRSAAQPVSGRDSGIALPSVEQEPAGIPAGGGGACLF